MLKKGGLPMKEGSMPDKRLLYILSYLSLAVLLGALFLPGGMRKEISAALTICLCLAFSFALKKRRAPSIHSREVLGIVFVFGLFYLALLYISGLFFGFQNSAVPVSIRSIFTVALPIAVIVITSEIIRGVMLAQSSKAVSIFAYVSGVLSELIIFTDVYSIKAFSAFMDAAAQVLFPAITLNILLNYLSQRYGFLTGAVFRLLVTLYPYIIPVIPAIPDAITALIKLCLPLILLAFISILYEKRQKSAKQRRGGLTYAAVALCIGAAISFIMLISCNFRYGMIVIATESMTGEINKGDAMIYESYDGQLIREGDVIVFTRDGSRTVHRVVEIKNVGGETRYYTKGDANEKIDTGFATRADVIGIYKLKISYFGYPTLWMRSIFE